MKKLMFWSFVFAVSFFSFEGAALSASIANQTVTFQVVAINELSVNGNPGALIVNTAASGSEPTSATDSTTTYNVTTNGTNKKITGSIDTNMPANTSLKINLTAPAEATSAGAVILTTSPVDLITGITQKAENGRGITYTFTANVAAGIIASDTRTVTLTLTDGS
jgi:hypothetical protein